MEYKKNQGGGKRKIEEAEPTNFRMNRGLAPFSGEE
jgi:hypothetical protein